MGAGGFRPASSNMSVHVFSQPCLLLLILPLVLYILLISEIYG